MSWTVCINEFATRSSAQNLCQLSSYNWFSYVFSCLMFYMLYIATRIWWIKASQIVTARRNFWLKFPDTQRSLRRSPGTLAVFKEAVSRQERTKEGGQGRDKRGKREERSSLPSPLPIPGSLHRLVARTDTTDSGCSPFLHIRFCFDSVR